MIHIIESQPPLFPPQPFPPPNNPPLPPQHNNKRIMIKHPESFPLLLPPHPQFVAATSNILVPPKIDYGVYYVRRIHIVTTS